MNAPFWSPPSFPLYRGLVSNGEDPRCKMKYEIELLVSTCPTHPRMDCSLMCNQHFAAHSQQPQHVLSAMQTQSVAHPRIGNVQSGFFPPTLSLSEVVSTPRVAVSLWHGKRATFFSYVCIPSYTPQHPYELMNLIRNSCDQLRVVSSPRCIC